MTARHLGPIAQVLLILPTALFMMSLVVRGTGSLQYEPARTAQQIISWYAGRIWTLWVLLVLLPLAALGTGCVMLLSQSFERVRPGELFASLRTNPRCSSSLRRRLYPHSS